MNKTFSNAGLDSKVTILEFLKEETKNLYFYFDKKAHSYLKEKYPDYYEHFLLDAKGEIHLLGSVQKINKSGEMMIAICKMQYNSGDADTVYDDSSVSKFTCPLYPDGIEIEIPLWFVKGIQVCNK